MVRSTLVYLSGILLLCSFVFSAVDLSSFYKALSSGNEAAINEMLTRLNGESKSPKNNAYIGALTMKKAGFQKKVKDKVSTFKDGAHLLEDEIASNPSNTEFRFLRLTVQEHAPNILKYNKQISEDKKVVIDNFSKLNPELKKVITDYAKDSKVLKPTDLNK